MKNAASKTVISVIVPVYQEQENINTFVDRLVAIFPPERHEIIVVDGDPHQATLSALNAPDVAGAASSRGRGKQMNVGAAGAQGEILLFLHADTILPKNASELITAAMWDNDVVAGSFSLGIDSEKLSLKLIEFFGNVRSCWTRVPYGDQAIFMSRDFFREMGGYKEMPLMEDLELMTRVKKSGKRVAILSQRAITAPRRWQKDGAIKGTLRNWLIRILYHSGYSPEKLSRYYK